jgi:hypothetical protein
MIKKKQYLKNHRQLIKCREVTALGKCHRLGRSKLMGDHHADIATAPAPLSVLALAGLAMEPLRESLNH